MGRALGEAEELEQGLRSLASLVTRDLADLCTVDVATREGTLVRMAVAHGDPGLAEAARRLRRFAPDPEDPDDAFGRAVRTGEPLLVPEVGEGWLDEHVRDPEHREILAPLGLRSLIAAPLRASGRVVGLLWLASADPARWYDADALALAEELARRAALAVGHARLREEVRTARAAEAQFMASMSHEFRTPAHVAAMFAELLILGVPEPIPPAAREHAVHIRTATQHLDMLVQQVLTFSRLAADRDELRLDRVDVAALTRETAALIEPLARQKQLGFAVDLPEGEVEVRIDPDKLRQVLFNLLGNAVKFTESGEVRVGLREERERLVLEVADTGIGIAPEHREKVFEPFWRVSWASSAEPGGTGLGLGIVKHLVRLLEGEVEVESEPGLGSVFRVLLPLRREDS